MPLELKKKLKDKFKIIYFKQSKTFAKFKKFRPNVLRIIAKESDENENSNFMWWLWNKVCRKNKTIPKPMIQIGKFPILFHIMKIYEKNGINDFVLALGYKGKIIEKFFNLKNLKKLNNAYYKYLNQKPKN